MEDTIDPKKCYNCGKIFKYEKDLLRHRNRKTPCLIREVAPEDRMNPLRCIFCNKVFSKKNNLNSHLKICKIKNGGMDILDEKVRYEQKIRILEEKDQQKDNQIKEMQERMTQMEAQMKQLTLAPPLQTVNINNGIINHIHFHNYNQPKLDTLKITQDDLLVENITKKLIEMIYFNKEIPENHTIYLPNIKEERLLVHRDGTWDNVGKESIDRVWVDVKNTAFTTGHEKINGGDIYSTDDSFNRLYPVVREAIRSFNSGGEHAQCTSDELLQLVKGKRELIAQTLRGQQVV